MSQLNDISLVAQVVVFRNTRAFDQLVQKYQSPVRRFFLNLTCGDSELSDDLAQDTFIKAYTNIANFKNLSSFSTWLYRIAYNVFMEDVSIDKIAGITGCPVGTVKSHLSRAKDKLAIYLKQNGYDGNR